MNTVEVIAIRMMLDNNCLSICNALSSRNLSSLRITDPVAKKSLSTISESEKLELHDILLGMVQKKQFIKK